jgi:hypothetical protein
MPQIARSALQSGTPAAPLPCEASPPPRPFWRSRSGAAVRRYFDEVWNAGHLDVLDELLAAITSITLPARRTRRRAPAARNQLSPPFAALFPDLRFDIEDVLVDRDKVAVRVRMRGTHQGSLCGLPASGMWGGVNVVMTRT